jgi:hypothetical protein
MAMKRDTDRCQICKRQGCDCQAKISELVADLPPIPPDVLARIARLLSP